MSETAVRPGVRWGGIIGGALLALAAGAGILLLAVPDVFAVAGWIRPLLFSLRPEWFGAVVPLTLGVLVIALGVVWVVRRGTHAADREAEPTPGD
ncbi:hypothetical protein [Microbacterium rhizophilus]|uniref:hypothetical protein n=1 Tax=Microbacterium rhizophilus TaxID=3138934 RepID=UPI0031E555AA